MSVPKAFIKDVAIPISEDYHFDNSPFSFPVHNNGSPITRLRRRLSPWIYKRRLAREKASQHKDRSFIGRIKVSQKFLHFLRSGNKKGVFMVTGYRGMGKTSFVNWVLRIYMESHDQVKNILYRLFGWHSDICVIHITIAQKQPKEQDILRLMLVKIYEECKKHSLRYKGKRMLKQLLRFSLLLLVVPILYPIMLEYLPFIVPSEELFTGLQLPGWVGDVQHRIAVIFQYIAAKHHIVAAIFHYYIVAPLQFIAALPHMVMALIEWLSHRSIYLLLLSVMGLVFIRDSKALILLRDIFKRCYATSSSERSMQHEMGIAQWLPKLLAFSEKQTLNYPVASNKEIEMALINFLELVDNEFIFVFDELDKIESTAFVQQDGAEGPDRSTITYHEQVRERKQAIIDIIGGLKNFLTTANARFIFIAGREMFDATLADIADRQSSLGSMFNDVFYVESFLKESFDNSNNNSSVSIAIEAYLQHVLYNDTSVAEEKGQNLYTLTREKMKAAGMPDREQDKVIFCLQEFVIYLTYRSNGSPQKIIKTVHEFIRHMKKPEGSKSGHTIGSEMIYADINPEASRSLYFNFKDQYRIGFINYLYRPFLIEYGRTFKHYGDSIVASTSYLFDHLLKFHNFAFSISHLEMIPEVLSANRTPQLRTHIKKIVDYLSNKHIRETEIGLFQYKFISRTLNEITFLSKTFESESAAFNFTLDESHSIKVHVTNKINILRNALQKLPNGYNGTERQNFAMNFLQTMLGDLYFFDQEYDDAVIAYADAKRPMNDKELESISAGDFLILIKTKLKLGLAFEKINSYNDALPFYSDAVQAAKQFFYHQLKCKKKIAAGEKVESEVLDANMRLRAEILYDILQVVNQCFIANAVIQEKLGLDGISIRNLNRVLHEYFCLSESVRDHCGDNTLIDANVLLVVANLLYFKNNDRKWEKEKVPNTRLKVLELLQIINEDYPDPASALQVGPEWRTLYLYSAGLRKVLLGCNVPVDKWASDSIVFDLLASFKRHEVWENRLITKNGFKYIGIFLSNMGDALLSNLKAGEEEGMKFKLSDIFNWRTVREEVKKIKKYYKRRGENIKEWSDIKYFDNEFPKDAFLNSLLSSESTVEYTIANVLRCYFISGYSFIRRGRKFSTSFQYRKILYVLRLILDNASWRGAESVFAVDVLFLIEHTIKRPIVFIASQNHGHTDRHMLNKYKSIFSDDLAYRTDKYLEQHISFHPDVKEAEILFNYIKVQLGKADEATCHELVNNYTSLGTQYIRILELDLFAKLHQTKLKEIGKITDADAVEACREYLYCLLTILRSMDLYETDYMLGYTYQAYVHFRIGQLLLQLKKDHSHILEQAVEQILSLSEFKGSQTSRDEIYHFFMAKKYYAKALQLHMEGTEYRATMEDMIYLEDDINDNAYHFGAAMERYMLGNKLIKKYIRLCDQYLKRPN